MFSFTTSGSFNNTEAWLKRIQQDQAFRAILERGGFKGVLALRLATPVDSGRTAASWDFEIKTVRGGYILTFTNSDIENGFPVAVMIQYGHGTGSGGYIQGIDYINPALKPVFDEISDELWKVVTS